MVGGLEFQHGPSKWEGVVSENFTQGVDSANGLDRSFGAVGALDSERDPLI